MSNNGGITSQYGFCYQKIVFIWYMLSNISKTNIFIYEGKEDIDIDENKEHSGLFSFKNENLEDIQVKSGVVTKEIWAKVVENWIILEDQNVKTLVSENAFQFEKDSIETIDYIYQHIQQGRGKNKLAISRKAYDNLSKNFGDNKEMWKEKIKSTIDDANFIVKNLEDVENDIDTTYKEDYCTDICTYEEAKKLRVDQFKKECIARIDKFIMKKKSAVFNFNDFIKIETMIADNISDHKYQINIQELKPKKQAEAKKLLNNDQIREVAQLKAVNTNSNFIIRELTRELFYKDFREIYIESTKKTEIKNLEFEAFSNYEDTKDELECKGEYTTHDLFLETVAKGLKSSQLFPRGPIFNHGCYVYLTGKKVDGEIQISWSKK